MAKALDLHMLSTHEVDAIHLVERLMRARNVVAISLVNEDDDYDPKGGVEIVTYEGHDDLDTVPETHTARASLVDAFDRLNAGRDLQ